MFEPRQFRVVFWLDGGGSVWHALGLLAIWGSTLICVVGSILLGSVGYVTVL